jgi:hypothetical protein
MNFHGRPTLLWSGVLLLALAALGAWHSARAGLSYMVYHHTKFIPPREYERPETVARRCEDAYRLYPYNYYLCIWIAEKCWYARHDLDGSESPGRVELARLWCDRGLALNRRKSQLRLLKTRLLARHSVREAIDHWNDYVRWHFWEPHNHAILVELYAEAGDFAEALRSLEWVKGSKHYAEAHLKLQTAWAKEIARPPIAPPRPRP